MKELSFEVLKDMFDEWYADNHEYTLHDDEWDVEFEKWCENGEFIADFRRFE